jgi:two-component system, chemotaxis family, chemotaxis protein CheY
MVAAPLASHDAVDGPGHVALVVDDSKAMRMILSRMLRGLGFDVLQAENGREGLEVLGRAGTVEVALVDWNMPEMDGVEFVRRVRAERGPDGPRLMMVTSESDLTKVTAALEAGADEYAMKPFDVEVIREKLELLGLGSA